MSGATRRIPSPAVLLAALTVLAALACAGGDDRESGNVDESASSAGEVNVYSHRHYEADRELFRRFTEQTGIEVNVVTASADELITRLENEGEASPADVLITVDAGRLHRAKVRELLQPVTSETLEAAVPEHLRDRDGTWWGLTRRARIIAYAPDRVDPDELSDYLDLADEKWEGRILIRSSGNVYNQSLLASILAHHGAAAATEWAEGVVRNMARPPSGGDTDQVKGVAAGIGDLAVVNSYYVARLAASEAPDDRRVAEAVAVFFPDDEGPGTHVNVSGAGVTRHAANREEAIALLEFLVGEEAQALFASANHEYPVRPGVAWSPILESWGQFRADTLDLTVLGERNEAAVRIFDRAGWR
ncbi:MAG TPA: Fe(3+) ABC transporter substrate-binding protein [Gemmatimonadota bacterium]|nr:Fe(3+) ABC transporter substrate-binding protein [Gemmatimonadota bacterium]